MELFIALGFSMVLLVGLTFLFITDGIPGWVQQFNRNSSTFWNFGTVAMGTMTVIITWQEDKKNEMFIVYYSHY